MPRRNISAATLALSLICASRAVSADPTVSLISPTDHDLSNRTAVTFTASATAAAGLASATLHVGGPAQTVVFSGPAQVEDAQITASTPGTPNGGGMAINVDGQNPHAHGLVRFPGLIGGAAGQLPAGAVVMAATLRLNCTNAGNVMSFYRLTEEWIENEATWNQRRAGVPWSSPGADGAGSNAGVSVPGDCTTTGQRLIDITRFVQEWADGAANFGLVMTDSGTDGVDFSSSESGASPLLTVEYRSAPLPLDSQAISGTAAPVSFTATLAGGSHYWNVRVTDLNGQEASAAADFELTVDVTYPDAPVLVSPADGATGIATGASLRATVSDPGGGALDVSVSLRRQPEPEFTIIALPDTQHYSEAHPDIFASQTQWIVDNKTARNIVFVTHEGDIVEHNDLHSEWEVADANMSMLDGIVPYGMGPGNHDQPTTLYNQYFPYTRYEAQPWYGDHYQDLNDNNYQLFSGGGMDFVIVHLEFCPPAGAVAWADAVLKAYPERIGIMTTHGYLNGSAQRSVSGCTSTQYLWDGLAVPNPNLHFMLSGHVHAESRRTDVANGHPVFQMLADYQDRPNGGDGWLRIMRFVPAEDKIHVQTYSTWWNTFETDADSAFDLDFPMGGAFVSAGNVSVPSEATATVTPGLSPYTQYEWQVTVTNAGGKSRTGPVWRFATGSDVPPPDADGDGVADAADNCTAAANPDQRDSNDDGFGNACDADLNDSGLVTSTDYTILRSRLNTSDPDADLNGSGLVTSADFFMLRTMLNQPPGPSGLAP
jgi:hypothetical protein